jgi:BirA family transcriptional regulator, biotin operon repressor / biotin---[acetyl-CoA-carboxylase] ligase
MVVSLQSGVIYPSLLGLLADGRLHSGARLARLLGVSRALLASEIERLQAQGVEIKALARRGYRLPRPVELLDAERIRGAQSDAGERRLHHLEVLFEVDSTNTRLNLQPAPPAGQADVCMSELQHAGRGRRGRRWLAPFGSGIAMSLGWGFRDAARASPSLSLAAGVAICRAAERSGARGVRLKWPNDVWFEDRKLGGILLELRADAGGPVHVVIGVGLNVSLSAAARSEIELTGVRVAALADACREAISRNSVAGVLLDELLSMLAQYEQEGFAPFRDAWLKLDALRDRPARLLTGGGTISGTARGVDADGALLLESGGRIERVVSGEVSLRLTEGDA